MSTRGRVHAEDVSRPYTEPDLDATRGPGRLTPARLCYFCMEKDNLRTRKLSARTFTVCALHDTTGKFKVPQ